MPKSPCAVRRNSFSRPFHIVGLVEAALVAMMATELGGIPSRDAREHHNYSRPEGCTGGRRARGLRHCLGTSLDILLDDIRFGDGFINALTRFFLRDRGFDGNERREPLLIVVGHLATSNTHRKNATH